MTQQLQELIDKIKQEGVQQSEKEAQEIIAKAQSQAQQIIDAAKQKADKLIAEAKAEIKRSEESQRLGTRRLLWLDRLSADDCGLPIGGE